jgi:WD40 repeat protein
MKDLGDVKAMCMSTSGQRIVVGDSESGHIHIRDGDTGKLLHSLEGHDKQVSLLAMSGIGHRIVSACKDEPVIKVWDGEKLVLLRSLEGDTQDGRGPGQLSMSGDGLRVFSAHNKRSDSTSEIKVWDSGSGRLLRTLGYPLRIQCLSVNWTGTRVVHCIGDFERPQYSLMLWDGESGDVLCKVDDGPATRITCVSMSSSGYRIVSGSDSGKVEMWDGATLTPVCTLRESSIGHDPVTCSAMSASGHRVVAGSYRGDATLWDGETGELLRIVKGANGYEAELVDSWCISSSGHRLVSLKGIVQPWENPVNVIDCETGSLWRYAAVDITTEDAHLGVIGNICISRSGKSRIASWTPLPPGSSAKGVRRVWDGDTGELLHQTETEYGVVRAAMSHGGKRIVSCDCDDLVGCGYEPAEEDAAPVSYPHDIRIIDGDTGEVERTIKGVHLERVHDLCIGEVNWCMRIVTASADATIKMWDGDTGDLVRTFTGHEGAVYAVCADKNFYYIMSGGSDKTIKIWNRETGKLIRTITTAGPPTSLCTDEELKIIVSASTSRDGDFQIWDWETGQLVRTICDRERDASHVRMADQGDRFISSSHKAVKVWQTSTGKLLRTIATGGKSDLWSLDMNGSGERIVWLADESHINVIDDDGRDYLPTPADIMNRLPKQGLPALLDYLTAAPSLLLEAVQQKGRRFNLLLALIDSLLSAPTEGQPPSLAWVAQLLEACPLVSSASAVRDLGAALAAYQALPFFSSGCSCFCCFNALLKLSCLSRLRT